MFVTPPSEPSQTGMGPLLRIGEQKAGANIGPGRAMADRGSFGVPLSKLLHVHFQAGEFGRGARIARVESSFSPQMEAARPGNSFRLALGVGNLNRLVERLNPGPPLRLERLPDRFMIRVDLGLFLFRAVSKLSLWRAFCFLLQTDRRSSVWTRFDTFQL